MLRYVKTIVNGPVIEIYRDQVAEDGSVVRHVNFIPAVCLSIRAGEYGMDPVDDAEAVLDMLLHENDPAAIPEGETLPPITTAPTLEEARDVQLERCRKARDGHYQARRAKGVAAPTKRQDMQHVEVLESLVGLFAQDRQLAELSRMHMKEAVWAERERQGAPTISHKARLIDDIRQREGI